MPSFSYVALDIHGEEIKGFLEAANINAATSQLRDMGYFPTSVKQQTGTSKFGGPSKAGKAGGAMNFNIKIPGFSKRVGVNDLTTFTRELATLIDAGLPVVRSLNILKDQSKPGALKDILTEVIENIEGGSSLSEALTRHPSTFSKLYINMMKAGEVGGVLEQVLDKTAQFLEKDVALKRKIKGAMMYPILVTCAIVGILSVIMIVVIPQFVSTLADLAGEDAELPGPTQILLGAVRLITGRDFFKVPNFVWVLIGLILLIVMYKIIVGKFVKVKYLIDTLKLKIFVFGPLVKKATVARFARTFGTLITSGVPVLQALNIVKDTSGNEVLAKNVITVHDAVREGESISRPMSQSKFFPPMVINMVDVGEETGALDNMLMKVADAYEADVDTAVEGLSSLIEPILIIIMGLIVGFIVIALYMPLIGIAQKIG